MDSVDKLRVSNDASDYQWIRSEYLNKIADEIEAEIERDYMELPKDADGVPIRVGDVMLKSTGAPKPSYGEVVGISDDSVFFSAKNGWESNWASLTRHYHAPTVEDVLEEFGRKFAENYHYPHADDLIEKTADKLREVLRDGD